MTQSWTTPANNQSRITVSVGTEYDETIAVTEPKELTVTDSIKTVLTVTDLSE